MTKRAVFIINSRSSSLKYQLIGPVSGKVLVKSIAERIGTDKSEITHRANGEKHHDALSLPTHKEAFTRIIETFKENGPDPDSASVVGCGHRVMQGGWYFRKSAAINQDTHAKIVGLYDLTPLHNLAHPIGIDTTMELWPGLSHVATFDMAFLYDLPIRTQIHALGKETAAKYHIRRHGVHGTSHEYVSGLVYDHLEHDDVKQITLRLDNGTSACAELGRKTISASMGLTSLEGLVIGARAGDVDPAVVFHLLYKGMNVDELNTLFSEKSGVLGLCSDDDIRDVR